MHPIWTLLRCAIAAALMLFLAVAALAQPRATVLAAGERITLDGRLDEAAWQGAPLHERFVHAGSMET